MGVVVITKISGLMIKMTSGIVFLVKLGSKSSPSKTNNQFVEKFSHVKNGLGRFGFFAIRKHLLLGYNH